MRELGAFFLGALIGYGASELLTCGTNWVWRALQ